MCAKNCPDFFFGFTKILHNDYNRPRVGRVRIDFTFFSKICRKNPSLCSNGPRNSWIRGFIKLNYNWGWLRRVYWDETSHLQLEKHPLQY